MKNPIISIENPPHSIPATIDQLLAMGLTLADIEAGQKRLESEHFGPWQICSSLRGPIEECEYGEYSTPLWKRFGGPRKMSAPRSCGYDMEGWVSVDGKRRSAFTTSQSFELPDGRFVEVGVLHLRSEGWKSRN